MERHLGNHVSESRRDIRTKNSSGHFNLYDGWNELHCGAHVCFRDQTPSQVEIFDADPEDVEWELEDLGFDGAKLDGFASYVTFDEEIERQLVRIGLHCSRNLGHSVALDFSESSPTVVLYDHLFRIEMSPMRAVRALRSVKTSLFPHSEFWCFITTWKPRNWMMEFEQYMAQGWVTDDIECFLEMPDVKFIVNTYQGLDRFAKKCFNKWCEGDYLAMLELSKRIVEHQ